MNFILDTDSYKFSHFQGYPGDAEHVYSYAESRGGKYDTTVFFGAQRFLKQLADVRVTTENIDEAEAFAAAHGVPFNREGWEIIRDEYDGCIPVIVMAVPEGTVVPTRNVLMTVENSDPRMAWLTSYLETALLRAVWYPITVATRIHYMKKRIKPFYDRTSDLGDMGFAVLDFSARGCSSLETAKVGGLAHLISFMGSDNIPAVYDARRYYDEPMAAFSVPATEHSVMTSYGEMNEFESFAHLIDTMMPENGILSVVSDTWNIFRACDYWVALADRIRAKNGTLVVRPDSGEMLEVLPTVMRKLMDGFGYDVNSKGYRVLRNVKILQGDGINEDTVTIPFQIAENLKISADSIMTGSGGGLMQANIDRDTCKFAFKASEVTIAGKSFPISKNPVTDQGKRSKEGRLALVTNYGSPPFTIAERDLDFPEENILRLVYDNGELHNMESFATIRERLARKL